MLLNDILENDDDTAVLFISGNFQGQLISVISWTAVDRVLEACVEY